MSATATPAAPDDDGAAARVLAQARQWVEQRTRPSADFWQQPAQTLALGWAIKDLCYAAWTSDPPFTQRAASALADLHAQGLQHTPGHATPAEPHHTELAALAHWTRAIAQLTSGAMADAVVALDAAADAFAQVGKTAAAAQTRVPRIMALSMLGRHADAVACAEDAHRRFVALADWRSAAKTSLNLGSLHLRHDAYADAARHYRQASVLFARSVDREHSVMADIGIADALTALGDTEEAARIYARAGMRAATHRLPVLQALVDESMALLDLSCGRYGAALTGLEHARRRYDALDMPQHLAIAEKQLADAYLELRLLPEALALYAPALARFQALQMPDDAAWTLTQRGRAFALLAHAPNDSHAPEQRHAAAAAESFEQAALAFAQQDSPVGLAAVSLARAELALANQDAFGAAGNAAKAAAGFRLAGLANAHLRALITVAEADLLGAAQPGANRPEATHATFAHLLQRSEQAQMLSAQVRCHVGIGQAALAGADAVAAKAAFIAAVDLFEAQRRALPADDVRIAFLTDHIRPYHALLQLALDAHARTLGSAEAAQVLLWLDRARARALGERLNQGKRSPIDTAPPAINALRSRLNWLTRRLHQQQDDGDNPATLEQTRREVEHQLLEATRRERLTTAGPRTATGSGGNSNRDNDGSDLVADLMQQLQPNDAFVEYGVSEGRLFACVVRRAGVQVVHDLAPLVDVAAALQSTRFQIEALRHGAALLAAHMPRLTARVQAHLQRLYGLVWAGLAPAVADVDRVLIVAPAQLGGLPFAALHDGAQWLGARHAMAIAPSAQWVANALARPLQPLRRAVIAGEGSRLTHTEAETHAVAALFDEPTLLLGSAASVDAVHTASAAADVLHLACHAEFRSDNPLFSALHLADGLLTAERAETLALPAGIVVLSACDTGLGAGMVGDEHVGLVRAFFVAGAARVVASLWPVDDAATAVFMRNFYTALLAGAPASSALRQAQAAVRQDNPHPYFWAAFALHGGW